MLGRRDDDHQYTRKKTQGGGRRPGIAVYVCVQGGDQGAKAKKTSTAHQRFFSLPLPLTQTRTTMKEEVEDWYHRHFNIYAKAFVQSGSWYRSWYLVHPGKGGPLGRKRVLDLVW
jgi:hypothetical protein